MTLVEENGVFQGYIFIYGPNSTADRSTLVLNENVEEQEFTNLTAYTPYTFQVLVRTLYGIGEPSDELIVYTEEGGVLRFLSFNMDLEQQVYLCTNSIIIYNLKRR